MRKLFGIILIIITLSIFGQTVFASDIPCKVNVVFGICNDSAPEKPITHLYDNNPETTWSTTTNCPYDVNIDLILIDRVYLDYLEIEGIIYQAQNVSLFYYDKYNILQPFIGCKNISLSNGRIDLSLSDVRTNQLRLVIHNTANSQFSGDIRELKVYGHKTKSVRIKKQITVASDTEGYSSKYLNDCNTYTNWKPQNNSSDVVSVTLDEQTLVEKLKLYLKNVSAKFDFSAKVDGDWVTFGQEANLSSLGNGWYTISIPNLFTDSININISNYNTTATNDGIGEIEVWGESTDEHRKSFLVGENLTGNTALGFELNSLSDWDEAAVWLQVSTNVTEFTQEVKLNGVKLSYIAQFIELNNNKLIKIPIQKGELREGRNLLSINLAALSVQEAYFMLVKDTGRININSIKSSSEVELSYLYDGNKYSSSNNNSGINNIDIGFSYINIVDTIVFYGEELKLGSNILVSYWQNNTWIPLTANKIVCNETSIRIIDGTAPTSKVRIQYYDSVLSLNEIEAFGSISNSGPPTITITSPRNYSILTNNAVTIEGNVDNAEATLTLDGFPIELQGYLFSYNLNLPSNSSGLVTKKIVATDPQGQRSEKTVNFFINQSSIDLIPTLTSSLDEVTYTSQPQFMFYVNSANTALVKINSELANKDGDQYFTQINLEEGENIVLVEAENSSGVAARLERRIILDTQAPKLSFSEKIIYGNRVLIKGTCFDLITVAVEVNGNPAPIVDNVFFFTLSNLNFGNNIITVTARDMLGHEASISTEVFIEQIFSSSSASNGGDYTSIDTNYSIPVVDNSKNNPYNNYFSNNMESVSMATGGLDVSVTEFVFPGKAGFNLTISRMYNSDVAHRDFTFEKAAGINKLPGGLRPDKQSVPLDMFGHGWSLNIPWLFNVVKDDDYYDDSHEYYIRLADGSSIKYKLSNNVFYNYGGSFFELRYLPTENRYTLTFKDGSKYIFDSQGRPIIQIDSSGKNKIEYFYNSRELTMIRDSLGREVIFSYSSVNGKRVITSIRAGNKTISYKYNENGLLYQAFDPKNRKTEYTYKNFGEQTIGSCYVYYTYYEVCVLENCWEVPSPHLVDNTFQYPVCLLEKINYPTQGKSIYSYQEKSQNYDFFDYTFYGMKYVVQRNNLGEKQVDYSFILNNSSISDRTIQVPNQIVLNSSASENGKTQNYSYEHVYKNSSDYYKTTTPSKYEYIGPILVSDILKKDSVEIEKVNYSYNLKLLNPTLEQHFRSGQKIYELSCTYDDWGNLLTQRDSRKTNYELNIQYSNHSVYKNMPNTVTIKNYNPVTEETTTLVTSYTYDDTIGKPKTITKNDGTKNLVSSYAYYDDGSLWTETSPNGLVTEYKYNYFYGTDSRYLGNFVTKTISGIQNADGSEQILTHKYSNYYGLSEYEVDLRGYVTFYQYDELGRVTKEVLPDDDDTPFQSSDYSTFESVQLQLPTDNPYREYKYYDDANSIEYWNENRQKAKNIFDEYGKLKETTNYVNGDRYSTSEVKTTYNYNNFGHLESVVDPRGNSTDVEGDYTTWYEYDALGRLSQIVFPTEKAGDKSVYASLDYNDANNMLTLTREDRTTKIEEKKDWSDQLIQAIQYCDFENSQQTLNWFFQYDTAGNKIEEQRPNGTYSYKYDAFGRVENTFLPGVPIVGPGTINKDVLGIPITGTPVITSKYDLAGNLTEQISANENYLGLTNSFTKNKYDRLGRLIEVETKDNQGNLSGVTKYFYDAAGNKVKMIDANNHTWEYTYSARNLLLSEKDPIGNVTQYRYDPMGNKIAVIDPRNPLDPNSVPKVWYSYDADNNLVLTDPRGDKTFTTWYLYDQTNRLYRTVLPDQTPPQNPFVVTPNYDNPYTETWYDQVGNKTIEQDANGVITTSEYYPRNWLKSISDSLGVKQKFEYDNIGNQTKIYLRIGDGTFNLTLKDYDSLGRVRRVTYPNGDKEEFEYDALGNKTLYHDGNQHETHYTYNALGWLTQVQDPLDNITCYSYDPNGNQLATITANGLFTINRYDEQNRLIEQIDSLSQSTIHTYDAAGNKKESIDRRNTRSIYEYYDNNFLKQMNLIGNDGSTYSVSYEYDKAGNQTKAYDTSSINNVITYNPEGPDPLNRINLVQKEFDNDNNRRNYKIGYEYDKASQITAITYPETTNKIVYHYNNLNQLDEVQGFTKSAGIGYTSDGLLQSIQYLNDVSTNFTYDQNRRLQDLKVSKSGQELFNSSYSYDFANNISKIHNGITGKDSIYNYYDNNQLRSELVPLPKPELEKDQTLGNPGFKQADYLGDQPLDFAIEPTVIISLDYNASSIGLDFGTTAPKIKMVQLTPGASYQNHGLTSEAFDVYLSDNNSTYQPVASEDWELTTGSGGVLIITFKQTVAARYLKIHAQRDERDAEYEPVNTAQFLNEIAKVVQVYQEADTKQETYEYDRAGNRTKRIIKLVQNTKPFEYSYYANSNRLKTDGKYAYVYDNAGNLIKKGNKFNSEGETISFITSGDDTVYWEYKYDLLNRLIEVKKNDIVVTGYGYDPNNLRVVKRANDQTIHYIFEGETVIYKKKIEINQARSYVFALGKHLARVDGTIGDTTAKVYYYHTDHLGSIRVVTDQSGNVAWSSDYIAFGDRVNQFGSLEEQYGFAGKEFDQETGLYYFNARWYDADLGRFISEDPANQGINWYIYCENNPLGRIDPTGLFWSETRDIIGGAFHAVLNWGIDLGKFAAFCLTGIPWDIPQAQEDFQNFQYFLGSAIVQPVETARAVAYNVADTWNNANLHERAEMVTYAGLEIGSTFVGPKAFGLLNNIDNFGDVGQAFKYSSQVGGYVDGLVTDVGYAARFGSTFTAGKFMDSVGDSSSVGRYLSWADDLGLFSKGVKPNSINFYVKPNGDTIPSTGYKYGYLSHNNQISLDELNTSAIQPGNNGIRYISFDYYSTGKEARNYLQLPYEPNYRVTFDTLQIVDDLKIPFRNYNESPFLGVEPVTNSYYKWGTGGATQPITSLPIKFFWYDLLP